MPLPIRLWNPLDIFDDPPRKPRRGSTAAYRPSRLYDVPIPPKVKPRVKKEIEKRRKERVEERRQRPTSAMGLPLPSLPGVRAAVGDVKELAAAVIPVTKHVGRSAKRDIDKFVENRGLLGLMPSRKTQKEYFDLFKWTVADEKGDKRKRPKTQSELIGILAEGLRGWGRGIERALPNPFDPADRAEAKKTWSQDPIFALLDVVPFASMLTRPASIAKHAASAQRNEGVGIGQAAKLGLKESYRPGAIRRAGLQGGIAPRELRSEVGTAPGRVWSRTPLMRALQRSYDEAWEMSPKAANYRVGRARQRRETEQERQIRLELDEIQAPIAKLVYGKIGRAAGAFGFKKTMTPKERRTATALMYRLQMPTHLAHTDALDAVSSDLKEVLASGKIELPQNEGRRVKPMNLTEEQKAHLSQQIIDLDLARRDFDSGDIELDEFDEALGALAQIAQLSSDAGLKILKDTKRLDPDALDEIAEGWKRRSQVLPRRLAGRGHLTWRSLEGSEERAAWLDLLTNQLGEEQARTLMVAMDAFARKTRPQDPASWYEDRVGMPTPESAQAFVNRVGDDALFQMEAGVRRIVGSPDLDADPNARVFYSPLQRWVTEDWDKRYQSDRVSAQKLRNDVKGQTPEDWWRNGGFEEYFDSFAPGERVTKQEFKEHLSSALNAYNLEEHFFLNVGEPRMNFQQIRHPGDLRSSFDTYKRGAVISRDPGEGEYAELVMRLRADSRFGPYDKDPSGNMRWGSGMAHWGESNVVAHTRFQIFTEDGIKKMLIEEIQSDWTRDARKAPYRVVTDEDRAKAAAMQPAADRLNAEVDVRYREQQEVQAKMDQLNDERDFLVQQRMEVAGPDAAHLEDQLHELDRTWEDLLREYDEADRKLMDASIEADDLWKEIKELTDEGAPPSPFGTKYYRTVLRRLAREAVEQDVDEIVFQDPTSQFVRAAYNEDMPRLSGDKGGTDDLSPQPLLDWLLARERLWEDKLARANQRVELEIEQSGTPRAEWDQRDIDRLYFDDERHMRDQLRDLRNWRSIYGEQLPNALRKEYGLDPGEWRRNAYVGRYSQEFNTQHHDGAFSSTGDMPGMVLKVNDRMREQVANAQRLYQRNPDFKGLPRGATELLSDGRTQLHIFSGAGVDTVIHELGHIALHDLHADDLDTITGHFAGGRPVEEWTTAQHENYARTFERYFRKGEAPNPELASVFAKISAWMKEVWAQVKQRQPELPEDVRRVFDGMLPDDGGPTDELATYGYFPHRDLYELAQEDYRGGTRPAATGNVIGTPRLTREAIERDKNELVLYQTGRLNPDPAGLVDVYMRRLQFQATLDVRDHLYNEVGRSLEDPMPPGAWLVRNPAEPPEYITAQTRALSKGQELRRPNEPKPELERTLAISPKEFQDQIIKRATEAKEWLSDHENVRWVPGEYVRSRFPEVFAEKPRGQGWALLRTLTSLQRATGIYGRPIAYAAGNIPFNVTALLATMPFGNLRSAQQMARLRKRNPELYRALSSEAGQARAESGLPGVSYVKPQNRIQGAEQAVTKAQRGMADVLSSFSDDPFRVTAILTNARKRGYTSDEDLQRLLDEDGADLADVRQLTREQLLDFDALNPANQRLASNLLYLWPFMYAATKWPLMYAREYPARAGAYASLAEEEDERLLPSEVTNFWKSKGIDLQAVNPLGPAGDIATDLDLLLKDPTKLDLTVLKERLSPTVDLLVEGMGGGKKNALQNFARGTLPGVSELAAIFAGEDWRGSKMYADRDRPGPYLGTRHLRFWPRELNEEKMKEAIEQAKRDEITVATIDREREEDKAKVNRYLKAMGGVDYAEELQQSFTAWWEYQEAVGEKKDSTGQRKLTPVQQVEILDEVVRENFPEYAEDLYPLDVVREAKDMSTVEEYVKELRAIINDGRSSLFNDYRSYVAE